MNENKIRRSDITFELVEMVFKELLPAMLDDARKQKGSCLTGREILAVLQALNDKLNEN